MHEILNFSCYYFDSQLQLINKKVNKPQKLFGNKYKIKCDITKQFQWKSRNNLLALANIYLQVPKDAKQILNASKYFIDTGGNVYSFNINKSGALLKPSLHHSGYLYVNIVLDSGVKVSRNIHTLVCNAFIMENYIEKGLCCLHLNNNKQDNSLQNLAVGTYSQNNIQAYADGLNPGNGLKKVTTT